MMGQATTGEPAAPAHHALNIVILEGEGALNNIRERDAREPIVQVQDENHRPIAGALVLFAANDTGGGASATFNALNSLSVTTGADGIAHGTGFQTNRVPGRYAVTVSATYGTMLATAMIYEANFLGPLPGQPQPVASPAGHGFFHTLTTSGPLETVLAGALLAGVISFEATFAKGGTISTQITPGTGTVGAPSVVKGPAIHFGGTKK